MVMKPFFPENWSHSLAERKSRDDMEEGARAHQPFEAHCDELVAPISSSIFESDGLEFLKSSVRVLENSAFSQSSALSYGEKLEDTSRAE